MFFVKYVYWWSHNYITVWTLNNFEKSNSSKCQILSISKNRTVRNVDHWTISKNQTVQNVVHWTILKNRTVQNVDQFVPSL